MTATPQPLSDVFTPAVQLFTERVYQAGLAEHLRQFDRSVQWKRGLITLTAEPVPHPQGLTDGRRITLTDGDESIVFGAVLDLPEAGLKLLSVVTQEHAGDGADLIYGLVEQCVARWPATPELRQGFFTPL